MEHILSQEQFTEFKALIKTKAANKQLTATDIIVYNIIRGKDIKRGFTPITNPKTLLYQCNGNRWMRFNWIVHYLPWSIKSKGVGIELSTETLAKILEALK